MPQVIFETSMGICVPGAGLRGPVKETSISQYILSAIEPSLEHILAAIYSTGALKILIPAYQKNRKIFSRKHSLKINLFFYITPYYRLTSFLGCLAGFGWFRWSWAAGVNTLVCHDAHTAVSRSLISLCSIPLFKPSVKEPPRWRADRHCSGWWDDRHHAKHTHKPRRRGLPSVSIEKRTRQASGLKRGLS